MDAPRGSVRNWLDRRAVETPSALSHIFADTGEFLTWSMLRDEAVEVGRLPRPALNEQRGCVTQPLLGNLPIHRARFRENRAPQGTATGEERR